MTNQRTKIIDCIEECRIKSFDSHTDGELARMYTDDLVNVLIKECYELREKYDELENFLLESGENKTT